MPGSSEGQQVSAEEGARAEGDSTCGFGRDHPKSSPVPVHASVASRPGPVVETRVSWDPRQARGGEAALRASREVCP